MSPHPIFDFLALPLELQRLVYGYIRPLNAPISSYTGLLLACKQIYNEAVPVILDNAQSDFKALRSVKVDHEPPVIIGRPLTHEERFKQLNTIFFKMPNSLRDLSITAVTVPTLDFTKVEQQARLRIVLDLFFVLHLRHLTVTQTRGLGLDTKRGLKLRFGRGATDAHGKMRKLLVLDETGFGRAGEYEEWETVFDVLNERNGGGWSLLRFTKRKLNGMLITHMM